MRLVEGDRRGALELSAFLLQVVADALMAPRAAREPDVLRAPVRRAVAPVRRSVREVVVEVGQRAFRHGVDGVLADKWLYVQ